MKKNYLSPIILFVYNRPEHTKKTLEALRNNVLANESELFIFADGPKENAVHEQMEKINETRAICKSIKGFKSVIVYESTANKGLAQNIISGVTEIINKYGKVIVIEDDIITSEKFLSFMNEALNKYIDSKNVYAISGWFYPIKNDNEEAFFLKNFNCWGWATWRDKWSCFKKDAAFYRRVFTKKQKYEFNVDNCLDYWSQIEDNYHGIRNTWFIFWYASAFLKEGLCLYPPKSLVINSGCDGSGENCSIEYYKTNPLSEMNEIILPDIIIENNSIRELLKKYLTEVNKKMWLRILVRSILRKLGLYSFARKIYKTIR